MQSSNAADPILQSGLSQSPDFQVGENQLGSAANPLAIPLSLTLPVVLVFGIVAFWLLNSLFPVFIIAEELRRPFPPDGVALVREIAFARARLTNTLLAFSCLTFALTVVLPIALVLAKRVQAKSIQYTVGIALGCSLLACIGVLLAHAVMELTTSHSLGITRTFVAHWLEFGFFGLAVGLAAGYPIGGWRIALDAAQRGLVAGLISATVFDLTSVVVPRFRLDSLIPGGVLWGSRDSVLIAIWVAFLLIPLAIAFQSIGTKRPEKAPKA